MAGDPIDTVDPTHLIGKVLDGRYRVDSVLGAGGMGMVFKATQTSIQRAVAIKTLHPQLAMSPQFFERFRREAEIASRLKHPNIITIYDFGRSQDGMCFFVMELLEGESLRQRVKRDGPLTLRQAAAVVEQVADGVGHAHKQNVVHRDIKPHNVMITTVDGAEYVKVLDFGLVKAIEQEESEHLTSTGQVLGTPQYMPPEQAGGELVDQRSDLYSLTAVFFYVLTGHSPYGANTVRKALQASLSKPVPAIATYRVGAPVPEALDRFVKKGLAPEKEDRFQSAEEFVQELKAALVGVPDSLLDAVPTHVPSTSTKESGSGSGTSSSRAGKARAVTKTVGPQSRALPKTGAAISSVQVAPSLAGDATPKPASPMRWVVVAAGALALVVGGAVVMKVLSAPAPVPVEPAPAKIARPEPAVAPPAPPADAPAATVKVTLETTPPAAEVIEDGVVIGKTPLTADWPRGARRNLVFHLAGYKDLEKALKPEADQRFDFALEAVAKGTPSRKAPKSHDSDIQAFE